MPTLSVMTTSSILLDALHIISKGLVQLGSWIMDQKSVLSSINQISFCILSLKARVTSFYNKFDSEKTFTIEIFDKTPIKIHILKLLVLI